MNPNKGKLLCFCILSAVIWCLYLLTYGKGLTLGWDAKHTYALMIDRDFICDWHSDIYIYECILLKRILRHTLSEYANGSTCVCISGWISWVAVLFTGTLWVCRFGKKTPYVFFILPVFWFCLYRIFFGNSLSLDTIFLAPAFLTLELAYQMKCARLKLHKIILLIILLFVSVHLISFRKNAIIAIIPLIYLILPLSFHRFERSIRLISSIGISICVYLMSTMGTGILLHTEKGYPLIPMLASHLSTTQSLRNINYHDAIWETPDTDYNLIQSTGFPKLYFTYPFNIPLKANDRAYHESRRAAYCLLKNSLIHEACEHPKEFLTSKILHICQFYTYGEKPSFMIHYLVRQYPHLKGAPELNQGSFSPFAAIRRLLILLVSIVGAMMSSYQARKADSASYNEYFFQLLTFSFAAAYLISFAIVSPTVDRRYTIIILALLSIHLPLMLCSCMDHLKRRFSLTTPPPPQRPTA